MVYLPPGLVLARDLQLADITKENLSHRQDAAGTRHQLGRLRSLTALGRKSPQPVVLPDTSRCPLQMPHFTQP